MHMNEEKTNLLIVILFLERITFSLNQPIQENLHTYVTNGYGKMVLI